MSRLYEDQLANNTIPYKELISGLEKAIKEKNNEKFEQLLSRRNKYEDLMDNNGNPLVWHAVYQGNAFALKKLINHGSNVAIKIRGTKAGLISIAVNSDSDDKYEIVQILLKNKANINAQDVLGETALHKLFKFGIGNGDTEMCALLLNSGVDASIKNNHGETALDIAESNPFLSKLSLEFFKQALAQSSE